MLFSFILLLLNRLVTSFDTSQDALSDDPLLVLRQKSLTSPNCGHTWQDNFIKLNIEIREGKSPLRYFIVAHDGQGANDRLTSIITGFYAAVLSNRAFFLMTYNGVPGFQSAFDTPYIDVNLPHDWLTTLTSREPDDVQLPNMAKLYYRDRNPLFHPSYDNTTTFDLLGDKEVIWYNSNRGYSYRLVKDSPYGRTLRDFGLNPFYSMNCAFHFLFRPNSLTEGFASSLADYFKDSNIVKIGIQIRTGDDHMTANTPLSLNSSFYYQNFFNCANYLEKTRIATEHGNKKVLWYVMSDSSQLKQNIKQVYGDKVIMYSQWKPSHTGNGDRTDRGTKAISFLFAEQLTMSLCDYTVISHDSAVGRIAAWLSIHGGSGTNTYYEHRDYALDLSNEPICKNYGGNYQFADKGAGI